VDLMNKRKQKKQRKKLIRELHLAIGEFIPLMLLFSSEYARKLQKPFRTRSIYHTPLNQIAEFIEAALE
jgi:hypothetical protein